jgi:surface antigen
MKLLSVFAALLAVGLAVMVPLPSAAQFIPAPMGPEMMPEGLTRDDLALLSAASAKVYSPETVAVGAVESWVNPKTGNSGTVTLIRQYERGDMPCRQFTHRIKLAGRAEQTYTFSRCRVAPGEWKLIG